MTQRDDGLSPKAAPAEPHDLFASWFDHARDQGEPLAHAMSLATATVDGMPSVRAVLMKDHSPQGITFFSNALSRKGTDLTTNPRAALGFVWKSVDRQVRIEGTVHQVPDEVADAYWLTRPARARAGAAASPQSRVIPSRTTLLDEVARLEVDHPDGVPRPEHWIGWVVRPTRWEFWQGRDDRLHDRVEYVPDLDQWTRHRLAP